MKIFYALHSFAPRNLFARDDSQRMEIAKYLAVHHSLVIQIHFRRFRQHIFVIPGFFLLFAEEISQFPLDRDMDQGFCFPRDAMDLMLKEFRYVICIRHADINLIPA